MPLARVQLLWLSHRDTHATTPHAAAVLARYPPLLLWRGGCVCVHLPSTSAPQGQNITPTWRAGDLQTALLVLIVSLLLAALLLTPANRGRFIRSLADFTSTRGSREHEAASVAALLSNRSAV